MILLKLICIFPLILINEFVFADINCTKIEFKNSYEYICDFDCGEKNNNERNVFTVGKATYYWIGSYEKPTIREMSLKNCSFGDESTWQGEFNLKKLTVSNNNLTEIPRQLLSGNLPIEYLDFSNNFIQRIDPSAFEGVHNLLNLDLSRNNLTHLNENAFDELVNLKELNLSYNPIGHLEIEPFAYLQQLEILSLKHINTGSIQLGIFLHQHKLISLDLSENQWKIVDFELYSPIFYNLRTLDLSQNQLTDLHGFQNIIFPQLTALDIRNNQFNCTYLLNFIGKVDWTKLRMVDDPQLTKEHGTNIRGVNCKNTSSSETSHKNDANSSVQYIARLNNPTENTPESNDLVQQLHNDLNFLKFCMISLCILYLIFLVAFLSRGL